MSHRRMKPAPRAFNLYADITLCGFTWKVVHLGEILWGIQKFGRKFFSSNSWYSTWNLFIDFCEFHSRTFPVGLRITQKLVQHNSKAWGIYWKSLLIFSESLESKNWKWNPIIFWFQKLKKWNSKMHRILIKIFFLKSTHQRTY